MLENIRESCNNMYLLFCVFFCLYVYAVCYFRSICCIVIVMFVCFYCFYSGMLYSRCGIVVRNIDSHCSIAVRAV